MGDARAESTVPFGNLQGQSVALLAMAPQRHGNNKA